MWRSCNCDFSACCYCGITEQSITGGSFAFDFSGQTQPQCELTVGNKTAVCVGRLVNNVVVYRGVRLGSVGQQKGGKELKKLCNGEGKKRNKRKGLGGRREGKVKVILLAGARRISHCFFLI